MMALLLGFDKYLVLDNIFGVLYSE